MAPKVLILNSGRCSWGKCVFCGWGRLESGTDVESLKQKVEQGLVPGTESVKVFASGSFLDDRQFPKEFRLWFANKCREAGVRDVIFESRPEFITSDSLSAFKGINLTVAIGLEAADDGLLKKLNKGFGLAEFEAACKILRKNKCGVRVYLLVNPPFVEDVADEVKQSVEYSLKFADSVVLINTFPHSLAPLFDLWIKREWSPLDKEQFEKITEPWIDDARVEKDFSNWAFVPKFPKNLQVFLKGVGEEFLTHPYYEVWQDYLVRLYEPPKDKDILLFLPCAFRKPYSTSQLHRGIFKTLRGIPNSQRIHHVMISSPGIIPREYERYYPFAHYDWQEWEETPEIKKRYTEVTQQRLEKWLSKHYSHYKKVFFYLKPDSESRQALVQACEKLGIEAVDCVDEDVYEKFKETLKKNPLADEIFLSGLKSKLQELKF